MRRAPILPLTALTTSFGIIALLLYSPLARSSTMGALTSGDWIHPTDDAVIYGTLIDDLFTVFRAHTAVIDDSITVMGTGEFAHRPTQTPGPSFAPALADYVAENQTADNIDSDVIPVHDGVLLIAGGKPRMGSRDTLTIGLSRVGFNPDHTRAVLYFAFGCGALCAQGDIVWLRRDYGGHWHIYERQTLWVS